MDTRAKIISAAEFEKKRVDRSDFCVVSGYFDPVLAAHAARLKELAAAGDPLVVVVDDPPDPLLPAGSRAELLAGLASVTWVVWAPGESAAIVADHREHQADLRRRLELVARVRRCHNGA